MIQQGPLRLLFSFLGPKDSFTQATWAHKQGKELFVWGSQCPFLTYRTMGRGEAAPGGDPLGMGVTGPEPLVSPVLLRGETSPTRHSVSPLLLQIQGEFQSPSYREWPKRCWCDEKWSPEKSCPPSFLCFSYHPPERRVSGLWIKAHSWPQGLTSLPSPCPRQAFLGEGVGVGCRCPHLHQCSSRPPQISVIAGYELLSFQDYLLLFFLNTQNLGETRALSQKMIFQGQSWGSQFYSVASLESFVCRNSFQLPFNYLKWDSGNSPVVWWLALTARAQVWSLVRELKSYKLWGVAKKKKSQVHTNIPPQRLAVRIKWI